jgi:hypothetical protein
MCLTILKSAKWEVGVRMKDIIKLVFNCNHRQGRIGRCYKKIARSNPAHHRTLTPVRRGEPVLTAIELTANGISFAWGA